MENEEIKKVKKSINQIDEFISSKLSDGVIEPVECNPLIMRNIIKYISYLENQVELNKIDNREEFEDQMNILFIKGHYPELVKALRKSDTYDFGDKTWSCDLIKSFNKITTLKGSLYEIITMLEKIQEINNSKKKGK